MYRSSEMMTGIIYYTHVRGLITTKIKVRPIPEGIPKIITMEMTTISTEKVISRAGG